MKRAATALVLTAALAALVAGCSSSDLRELDGVADIQQRQAQLRLQKAVLHYQQGREDIALLEASQAVTLDPGLARAYGLMAAIHAGRGQVNQAERHYQFGLRLVPGDAELANGYGVFLCQARGRPAQARRYFDAAIANPDNPDPLAAMVNGGMCSLRHGELAFAERYLVAAARLQPKLAAINAGLAHIHYERHDFARASVYMNRLFETEAIGSLSADALWLAIRLGRRLGDQNREAQLASVLRRAYPYSPELAAFERGFFDE